MPYTEDMPDEMLRLTRRLLEQTRKKQIEWSITDRDDRFLFSSTRSSALIAKNRGPSEYRLWLLNSRGAAIASIETRRSLDPATGDLVEATQNGMLEELYYSARDSALDVGNTLEDMFNSLGIELGPNAE